MNEDIPKIMKAQYLIAIRELNIMSKFFVSRTNALKLSILQQKNIEDTINNAEKFRSHLQELKKLLFNTECSFEKKVDVHLKGIEDFTPLSKDTKEDVSPTGQKEPHHAIRKYSTEDEGFKSSAQDDNDDEPEKPVSIRPTKKDELIVICDTSSSEEANTPSLSSDSSDTKPSYMDSVKRRKQRSGSSGNSSSDSSDTKSFKKESAKRKKRRIGSSGNSSANTTSLSSDSSDTEPSYMDSLKRKKQRSGSSGNSSSDSSYTKPFKKESAKRKKRRIGSSGNCSANTTSLSPDSSDTEPSKTVSFCKNKRSGSSGEETMMPSECWDSDTTVLIQKKKKKLVKKRKLSKPQSAPEDSCSKKLIIPDFLPSEEFEFQTIDPALVEISEESDCEKNNEPLNFQEESSIPHVNEKIKNHGRKNIRKIISPEEMAIESRRAAKEQEERQFRIMENEKFLARFFPVTEPNTLILDFDKVTKITRVQVHPDLVRVLSEQQREGVKFMWNACFESVEQVKSTAGSGCIVSHSMGLGKSLQIIAITHTIIGHPVLNLNKILIVCPKSDILRWVDKFVEWQRKLSEKVEVFNLTSFEDVSTRERQLRNWQYRGGVMILGYDEFRSLVLPTPSQEKLQDTVYKNVFRHLINPGPDVIIFDEGHLFKKDTTCKYKAASMVRTQRRILLTGTPFQNHLSEFYHMMNLVKPFYLGDKIEFSNIFANPIMNGQFRDSTRSDIEFMKSSIRVLRQKLRGIVHFVDLKVFESILPVTREFIIKLRMSQTQISAYRWWCDNVDIDGTQSNNRGRQSEKVNLLSQVCNHPKIALDGLSAERLQLLGVGGLSLNNVGSSPKVDLFFKILKECSKNEEKLIVFSQFWKTLDLLESFLKNSYPKWSPGIDYFRLDGRSSLEDRQRYCRIFNSENKRAKLFLLTKGDVGLGLNLTGANRVIIFDASWNPSVDSQCGFRICRFGQKKPCYIYRFIMKGTVEEKKFDQQASKLSFSTRRKSQDDRSDLQNLEYNFNYGQRTTPKVSNDGILAEIFQKFNFIDSCEEQNMLSEDCSLNREFSSSSMMNLNI